MINVFILTYCRNLELLYGTELIFKTLRVGFPNANVHVVDNNSLPETVGGIELLAKQNDCSFEQIPSPGLHHYEFIQRTISKIAEEKASEDPLVFLDPDICFWDSCEDFEFDGLIAGKMCRGHDETITHSFSMQRLHSSFLWIPSAQKLMHEIRRIRAVHFDFEPFQPYSCVMNGEWFRFDTGANLSNALGNKISAFTEHHFNRYDHIFGGSHFDWVYPHMKKSVQKLFRRIHSSAKKGDLQALKGIWKVIDVVA